MSPCSGRAELTEELIRDVNIAAPGIPSKHLSRAGLGSVPRRPHLREKLADNLLAVVALDASDFSRVSISQRKACLAG